MSFRCVRCRPQAESDETRYRRACSATPTRRLPPRPPRFTIVQRDSNRRAHNETEHFSVGIVVYLSHSNRLALPGW